VIPIGAAFEAAPPASEEAGARRRPGFSFSAGITSVTQQ
jgi:hypothetical protein